MADISQYKVGVVLSVDPCPSKGGKPLRACRINVGDGDGDGAITVVTSASNVREGSRVAVAPIGSRVTDEAGEEAVPVQRTAVGGVASEGVLCDSRMLGWAGGAAGLAAQMPDSVPIGAAPPAEKPRSDKSVQFEKEKEPEAPAVEVKPLFDKKPTKEEKKRLAEEKRKARKAAKEAKKQAEDS